MSRVIKRTAYLLGWAVFLSFVVASVGCTILYVTVEDGAIRVEDGAVRGLDLGDLSDLLEESE